MKEENQAVEDTAVAENDFTDVAREGKNSKSYSYTEEVKGLILNSLADGTSVLLKDREGIDYIKNCDSGTTYQGTNQLYLKQFMAKEGHTNPYVMTIDQAQNMGMWPFENKKGAVINYYCKEGLRYKFDEYPIVDGVKDKSKEPLHKKGDFKLDAEGKNIPGYEYNYVYNVKDIDPNKKHFRRFAKPDAEGRKGYMEISSDAFIVNPKPEPLKNPYAKTAVSGLAYKAQDLNDTNEIFKQKVSEYFNSIITGSKYEGWKPTPTQVKELQTQISDVNSPFFKNVNEAFYIAVGNTEKLKFIQTRREEIAKGIPIEESATQKRSRAM